MMALALYRGATTAAAPLIRRYLHARLRAGKEDRARLDERFGVASLARPEGPLVWLHAASVGESLSMLSVIDRLLSERPALNVLITTGTVTSAQIMAERLPSTVIHQYTPVDSLPWVRRFLDHWRPNLVLWVESELWPNFLIETSGRGVPMVLMNARMSPRSYRAWRRAPGAARTLLRRFDLCLAQAEEEAQRLTALGAPTVECPGNVKYAAAPLPADTDALARLKIETEGRKLWLAASTHPGEEEQVAAAHARIRSSHPNLLTIIVPRHAVRGPEIASALAAENRVALRSRGDAIAQDTDIYIADSMGEMGLFYRLAEVVFIGGSLIPHGGQNPLEPAKLECAIVHGPHMGNFLAIEGELRAADATSEVSNPNDLAREVDALLGNDKLRMARIAAALDVAGQKTQILDSIFASLAPFLDRLDEDAAPAPRHARA